MTDRIRKALAFATEKHKGQKDCSGVDYVEHPKAVASLLKDPTEDEYIVALLHDTVEDTNTTIEEIQALFGDTVADGVSRLTHDPAVPYMDYVAEIKEHELAKKVKLADLTHNMDLNRLPEVTERDRKRLEKYRIAYALLTAD